MIAAHALMRAALVFPHNGWDERDPRPPRLRSSIAGNLPCSFTLAIAVSTAFASTLPFVCHHQ